MNPFTCLNDDSRRYAIRHIERSLLRPSSATTPLMATALSFALRLIIAHGFIQLILESLLPRYMDMKVFTELRIFEIAQN